MPKRLTADATKGDAALQPAADLPALTVAQANAVDALVSGKGDADAAAAAGVSRVTVSRWRHHSPVFMAALNDRRASAWASSGDRLRALAGKALGVLGAVLDDADHPHRVAVALAVLRHAPPAAGVSGPTDPAAIVRGLVAAKYDEVRELRGYQAERARGRVIDAMDGLTPLPSPAEALAAVLRDIDARLTGDAPPSQTGETEC